MPMRNMKIIPTTDFTKPLIAPITISISIGVEINHLESFKESKNMYLKTEEIMLLTVSSKGTYGYTNTNSICMLEPNNFRISYRWVPVN